jgi:hypothetical protein
MINSNTPLFILKEERGITSKLLNKAPIKI